VKPFGVKSSVSISALVDRFLGTVGRPAREPGSGEDSKVLSAAIHSMEFFSGMRRALAFLDQRIIKNFWIVFLLGLHADVVVNCVRPIQPGDMAVMKVKEQETSSTPATTLVG